LFVVSSRFHGFITATCASLKSATLRETTVKKFHFVRRPLFASLMDAELEDFSRMQIALRHAYLEEER